MVEFSPATRDARVRFPASARSPKVFVQNSLFFSFVVVVVVVVFFCCCCCFFPICAHTAHLLAHLFSCLYFFKLVILSRSVRFLLAMFCVASPIECASQRLFGSRNNDDFCVRVRNIFVITKRNDCRHEIHRYV